MVRESVIEPADVDRFNAGYRQATQDLLDWLVYGSEQFLHERTSAMQELRPILYAFVEQLEQKIVRNSQDHGYVEGGLGI